MTKTLPSRAALKAAAKDMRRVAAETGAPITQSKALETLAHKHGFRNWNALAAAAPDVSLYDQLVVGGPVHGTYLGHPFTGRLIGIKAAERDQRRSVTIRFDDAIDVVTSEHFSAFRRRVSAVIDESGVTRQTTSDGTPHLVLNTF